MAKKELPDGPSYDKVALSAQINSSEQQLATIPSVANLKACPVCGGNIFKFERQNHVILRVLSQTSKKGIHSGQDFAVILLKPTCEQCGEILAAHKALTTQAFIDGVKKIVDDL